MTAIALILYTPLTYCNGIVNMSVDTYGRYGVFSIMSFILISCLATVICCNVLRLISNGNKILTLFSVLGEQSLTLMMVHIPLFCLLSRILNILNHYQ